jgi:hypothetical protein
VSPPGPSLSLSPPPSGAPRGAVTDWSSFWSIGASLELMRRVALRCPIALEPESSLALALVPTHRPQPLLPHSSAWLVRAGLNGLCRSADGSVHFNFSVLGVFPPCMRGAVPPALEPPRLPHCTLHAYPSRRYSTHCIALKYAELTKRRERRAIANPRGAPTPPRSTLHLTTWSCGRFEGKGVSTSRVSPPGALSISYGHVGCLKAGSFPPPVCAHPVHSQYHMVMWAV